MEVFLMAMAPPPVRWLPAVLGALLLMITVGLGLVWWSGRKPAPPLPVLGSVPAFTLVDKSGATVTPATLAGRPWIVDLVFTRCQLSCPRMTERMASLGPRLPAGVRRVSVSVDPAHDTPAVLADYARAHKAEAPDWLFLTGDEAEMRRLAVDGLKLGVAPADPRDPRAAQEPVTHSTRFVLVDAAGRVRGYYDAFDEGAVGTMLRDAAALAQGEKGESGGAAP
ncbi:MAG TPA: SCO family protein [Thermoanaerobaculia bacterium]|nr:SCO family protein [Thermoanaerobaculia bacterium]